MSRSKSKERQGRKYASVKKWVEKQSTGFTSSYLKLPKGVSLFQPKEGVKYIDILPYQTGEGNPMAEPGSLYWERTFWVHRNIGPNQETFVCPAKVLKKRCPICEARAKLMKNEPDEDEEQLAKDLLPKERQVFNVIDKKQADKGVMLWDMSFFTFGEVLQKELRDAEEDDGWDLFFTADQGFTLKVGFGEDSFGKGSFLRADTVHFKKRAEQYEVEAILEQTHCLDDLLVILPYDKLKSIFLQAADDDEEDEEEDDGPKKKGKKPVGKRSRDDEDEEEEPEEDDDDEEDEEKAPPRRSKEPVKSKKSKSDDDEDEEEEEDLDDFDEEPEEDEEEEGDDEEPSPKKKVKKKAEPEEDEDEEEGEEPDDDWEEDDEEKEPSPKSKKKTKSKSEEPEEDEEPEDDDWEDEEEEEEQETPRGGKFRTASPKDVKRAKTAAKKRKAKEEEEPEEDEEEEEPDDDWEEEEEEEEAPSRKKKARK